MKEKRTEELIGLINSSLSAPTPVELAAGYAVAEAEESGDLVDGQALAAQLEHLADAGAVFDLATALELALAVSYAGK